MSDQLKFRELVCDVDTAIVELRGFLVDKAPTDKIADEVWTELEVVIYRLHDVTDPLHSEEWLA